MSTRVRTPPRRPRAADPAPHPALERRRRQVRRERRAGVRRLALWGAGGVACAAFGWWLATGPVLTVRDVRVSGYDRPDAASLDAAVTRAAARGGSLLAPPVGAIRRAAIRYPWVKDVVVRRDLPLGIVVQVVPQEPAAVAVPARGTPVLVSPDGLVMGPAAGVRGLPRLRIRGEAPGETAPLPASTRAPMAFVRALDPEAAARIRALRVERGNVLARLSGGPELRLGPPTRMAAKAFALQAVLAGVSAQDVRAADYIELTVPERPALGGLEDVENPVPEADAAETSTSTGG